MENENNRRGKTEQSLCVPQYFAWVNHGNDGSTEEQTLKNLEFFAYLQAEYGMELKIYALDAGNFDSPMECYFDPENPMTKKNFPNWLAPVAKRAAELGIRLGLWCGPDGFGDTEESEKRRTDQVVSLCRDYGVALLKFDAVCGPLRPEKQAAFEKMIAECRKYCPDLIVLNHRIEMGEAEQYATTFLWEGRETYVDVLIHNEKTAPHHRQGGLARGLVPGLRRLTEDHGVCLSSSLDYFEDELVLQAFNRSLILSPEIYGTPALLKDCELPRLARIYTVSRKYADLLVSGKTLPPPYGESAVSRGNGETRIVTLRNNSWSPVTVTLRFDELGLSENGPVTVMQYFPTQRLLGVFGYRETVPVTVEPFRALMLAAGRVREDIFLSDCDYEVIRDLPGRPVEIRVIRGRETVVSGAALRSASLNGQPVDPGKPIPVRTDEYPDPPVKLGTLTVTGSVPEKAEMLYEKACFAISNDSLERRSARRAGKSRIPQVEAVREAFFSQEAYRFLGCESAALFDGDPESYFDCISRICGLRIRGGCLRIDLHETLDFDEMRIEYFDEPEENAEGLVKNLCPQEGSASEDLLCWKPFYASETRTVGEAAAPVVQQTVERVRYVAGKRKQTSYRVGAPARYLRLPEPMDRIYGISFYKDGKEVKPNGTPFASNLMAPYEKKTPRAGLCGTVRLPEDYRTGSYLSIACEGTHGPEGVYFVGLSEEGILCCPDRAPSYPANPWGHWVCTVSEHYTYYMPLPDSLRGKSLLLQGLVCRDGETDFRADVYLCSPCRGEEGAMLVLEKETGKGEEGQ